MKPLIHACCLALLLSSAAAHAGNANLDRNAKAIGAKQCLSAIKAHAERVIEASSHEADMAWHTEQPDSRLLSYFVSKGRFDVDTQVNMLFVPNPTGGCDTVITETFVVEKTCELFQEQKLQDWKSRALLNRRTIVLQGTDNRIGLYLTPAGITADLCLVTRREVGFS